MGNIAPRKSTPSASPAALRRELLSAAHHEADAEVTRMLTAVVHLLDRRTPGHLRSLFASEMLDIVSSLAFRDELTGLLNRRGFMRQAAQLLELASRSGRRTTLFFADVNNLKRVNDGAGHEAGDGLLTRAGHVLRSTFRRVDVLGRLGGDEFAALALSPNEASDRRLRQRLENAQRQLNARSGQPEVSLSVGCASCEVGQRPSLEALLRRADQRMYAVKLARRRVRQSDLPVPPQFAENPRNQELPAWS